jgi:hypothetical protein
MALPRLNESPQYELTIPSTQEVIQFRPFLVKEQKVLLMAFETKDKKQILNSILATIKACCTNIDEKKLTSFDVDYVFTNIRTKAVGETTTIAVKCSDESCLHSNEVVVNLENAELINLNESNIVKINNDISLKMKWPSYTEIINNKIITEDNYSNTEIVYETIKMSIDSIMTEDELISLKDESNEEIDQFINSLTTSQFNEINKFISNAPTLKYDVKFTCESCGKENHNVLEGIQDFFS